MGIDRRGMGQETGGHLISQATEVVMDLEFQPGQTGGVASESVPPLLLKRLGLSVERMEEVVARGDRGAGPGLEAYLHGQLTVTGMRAQRSGSTVRGHSS